MAPTGVIILTVLGLVAFGGLVALAWWSSGRARPLAAERRLSQVERDYLADSAQRNASQLGGSGGGFGVGG